MMTMNKIWNFSWVAVSLVLALAAGCKNGNAGGDPSEEKNVTLDFAGGTPEEMAVPLKIGVAVNKGALAGEILRSNSKEAVGFNTGANRQIPGAYLFNLEFMRQANTIKLSLPFFMQEAKAGVYALGLQQDTLMMAPSIELLQVNAAGQEVKITATGGTGEITIDAYDQSMGTVRGKANILFAKMSETVAGGAPKTLENVKVQAIFNNQ